MNRFFEKGSNPIPEKNMREKNDFRNFSDFGAKENIPRGRRAEAFREPFPQTKIWKFSGPLFIITILLCSSSAHCVPGSEWRLVETSPLEDVGANSYTTAYLNVTYLDPETKKVRSEKSEVGKFGDGRVGPASGVLVHVSSWEGGFTGCAAPLRSSRGNGSLPHEPWIALVKRGQCNFEVKVENALRHNATAILVYNDRESPTLDKMKLLGMRNMSAVFTYKWKGEQLAKLVDNGSRIMVHITVATHCTRPNAHVNRTSVLFVSISFVVLMLTSLAWLVFYYVQRFRYLHAKDRLSKRLCNAAKKALSRIPTKEIQQEDQEVQGDGECCAVCIEPYKVTDDLRILPCRHEFHKGCIDPWLLEHRTCPMCKMNILKHYGFVFSTSQESVLQVDLERGEIEEINSSETGNNDAEQMQRATAGNRMERDNIQVRGIYSGSRADEEQSDQLLGGNEGEQLCLKCGSISEMGKRPNNARAAESIPVQKSTKLIHQVKAELSDLDEEGSDSKKNKSLTCEAQTKSRENGTSHVKSYEFFIGDNLESAETVSKPKSNCNGDDNDNDNDDISN